VTECNVGLRAVQVWLIGEGFECGPICENFEFSLLGDKLLPPIIGSENHRFHWFFVFGVDMSRRSLKVRILDMGELELFYGDHLRECFPLADPECFPKLVVRIREWENPSWDVRGSRHGLHGRG
jgi:hypothetical protein